MWELPLELDMMGYTDAKIAQMADKAVDERHACSTHLPSCAMRRRDELRFSVNAWHVSACSCSLDQRPAQRCTGAGTRTVRAISGGRPTMTMTTASLTQSATVTTRGMLPAQKSFAAGHVHKGPSAPSWHVT
jgi:hypothetical protein